jgi:hypothetical protein
MSLSWMQRRMRIEMTLDDIHEDLNLFAIPSGKKSNRNPVNTANVRPLGCAAVLLPHLASTCPDSPPMFASCFGVPAGTLSFCKPYLMDQELGAPVDARSLPVQCRFPDAGWFEECDACGNEIDGQFRITLQHPELLEAN